MAIGHGALFVLALLTGSSVQSAASAADGDTRPLSPAQIALFESDHLGTIRRAERLEYRFAREATTGDAIGSFSDRIEIDVRPRAGSDGKDVWTDFLSAEHHVPFPPLMDFHGNPVVMFFLERDIGEMRRLTAGAANYFRNRIREAFVDRAQVKAIDVLLDGKSLPATEIILTPFEQDQHIAAFPSLAGKRYRFVLCEAVPGRIVEIESEAPSKSGQFAVKETLTFAGEEPCTGDIGPCAPTSRQ